MFIVYFTDCGYINDFLMAYEISPCRFITQKKCLWIISAASLCACVVALHHMTYFNKTYTANITNKSAIMFTKKYATEGINNSSNSNKGFILVSKYFEQQTGAAINMLTLTKWAKTVGALPVEPFVKDSTFCGFVEAMHKNKTDNLLHFHDYFDIDLWNSMSLKVDAMPLVSYNTFMAQKPNKIILVQISVRDLPSKLAYTDNEIMNELEATKREDFLDFEAKHKNYIKRNNMTIVRRIYMSFVNHKAINIQQFNNIIYGGFDPSNVIVWFQVWEGISKTLRIKIIEEEYHRNLEVFNMLQTSQRIIDDSKKYAERILKSNFGEYLAISFRSVKRAKYFYVKNIRNEQLEFFKSCIQRLQHTISLMSNTKRIFLALDLGRFGDNKASKYLTSDVISTIEHDLFHILYNDTITLQKWEDQFVEVTEGIVDSGYIATMQATLLENSKCLIMFGGDSNFQRSLLTNFEQKHSDPCVRQVCYIY